MSQNENRLLVIEDMKQSEDHVHGALDYAESTTFRPKKTDNRS